MRSLVIAVALMVAACTPEQSKNIGNQPKKTIDTVTNKVQDAMKQGQESERLKDAENK